MARPCIAVKSLILVTILAFLVIVAPARADEHLNRAVKLYQEKDYRNAARILSEYLKDNSKNATAHYYAAMSYQQIGQLSPARYHYGRVAALAPNSKLASYAQTILQKIGSVSRGRSSGSIRTSRGATTGRGGASVEGPAQARIYYRLNRGEMFVPVEINGRRIDMQLDTGAPGITVGRNQLKDIGVNLARESDGKLGGSSNDARIPYWRVKATVKVGPLIIRNAPVKVMEHNHSDPLIGQGFLSHFDYTIDQGAKCVHFRRKGTMKSTGGATGYKVPFKFRARGRRIIVDVEINGSKHPVMLDTGNTASGISFNSKEQAQKYGAPVPANAPTSEHTGVSGSGTCYEFRIKRVRLGPIDRSNVEASAHMGIEDDEEPLLGQSFFKGWQFSIDMNKKVIHLLRR